MRAKKRYSLFNVFWVILAINIFFFILSVIVVKFLQSPETKAASEQLFTKNACLREIATVIFHTFFFYIALNLYNKLIVEKRSALPYILYSLCFFGGVFGYYCAVHYFLPEKMPVSGINEQKSFGLFIFSFSISSVFFVCLALLIAYLNNLRDEKKQRKILEAQKMQLEVDKSQANFKFLKSQINPHFLHNTLNFLYAKSLPYSAELSEGILTLSDIMRYALNEAAGSDDKAPLKDEIEHVRNVIKINQLRFSNNLNVNFEVQGVINGAEIIPFVLITIVENAFKHGDLQKPEYPIDIKLNVTNKRLYFYCRNKKKTGPKEISTGLGLDNIRNRLQFAYGSNYTLLIKDDTDFYTTELTIDTL